MEQNEHDKIHELKSIDEIRDGAMGELIDRRVQVYGEPTETFARIAQVWSGILGHEVNPVEVPLMMAGMKMVRAQVMPDYSDNSDDIAGYMDIFKKIVGPDMIHARTVNEFIEQKWGRPNNAATFVPAPSPETICQYCFNTISSKVGCLNPGCPKGAQ